MNVIFVLCIHNAPTVKNGRSVSIHPDELLLQELRERQNTPQGRAKLQGTCFC